MLTNKKVQLTREMQLNIENIVLIRIKYQLTDQISVLHSS